MFNNNNNKKNNSHPVLKTKMTFGQRAADLVTIWVGSWKFIIGLLVFMIIWIMLNIYMIISEWDPYPFILLNFVLSMLAAFQAPVILMSQNRQAERERVTAKYDYLINRKAEREIQAIKEDLDYIKNMVSKKKVNLAQIKMRKKSTFKPYQPRIPKGL
ncbi:MAG: DUF1003 domain-containing protein [Candidatus Woesearchaeota archaeon]|jgi:uncharacterized membrane protein|nr:DUF1003 domain-containing protein [Candidatus Woesearchaeota archaeon]MDP7610713.1 DUF1003 domain-containing protein [Candidatus Woesearchaeota archaeon]|tara:strand:+ start:4074 stop:4547 length:474 start_codon:yes stop_codon:yes gene_type:complete